MTSDKAKAFLTYQNKLKKAVNDIEEEFGGKVAEQEILNVLYNANWYFHEEFTPEEISRMQYNIACDFPIFLETCVGNLQQKVATFNAEIHGHLAAIETRNVRIDDQDREIKGLNERLNTILRLVVSDISGEVSVDGVDNAIMRQFTQDTIIMEKLNQGIALNEEELKIVRSKITNY